MRVLLLAILLLCLTQIMLVEALFGLAGLVALKAGAVGYALGRSAGRRRGYGYGHYGGRGYGRRGYGHGYHRYGRDLSAQQQQQQDGSVEAAQLDAYFAAVMVGDDDQCGLKLVCQLHADQQVQGDDAGMIRALFGSDVPSSGLADSPKRPYDEAAALGRSASSSEICTETFNRCNAEAQQLLQAIQ